MIHGYAQIDPKTVWITATTNLPRLSRDLAAMLALLDQPGR
jgi:uncharacterized protein with HEPN domain